MVICPNLLAIETPHNPVIFSNNNGKFEIYWFYPGLFREEFGNINDNPVAEAFCGSEDNRCAVFTPLKINPPIYISEISTIISNRDSYPDYPGDQYSPIRLSLKRNEIGTTFEEIWHSTVGLDKEYPDRYIGIANVVGLALMSDFQVWTVMEWLKGTPTAPAIALTAGPVFLDQYICSMEDPELDLTYTDFSFTTGLDILNWTSSDGITDNSKSDEPIHFNILFANELDDFDTRSTILMTVGSDSLRAIFESPNSGYMAVSANDGSATARSSITYLDKTMIMPLEINPSMPNIQCPEQQCSFEIDLSNTGSTSLNLTISYDTTLLQIADNLIMLESGQSRTITADVIGDLPENGDQEYRLFFIAENYYPMIYSVIIETDISTGIGDNIARLPGGFKVSRAYPNPFNPEVRFTITPIKNGTIRIKILNLLGRVIYSKRFKIDGIKDFRWDGSDIAGNQVSSGIYLFEFSSADEVIVRKAILMK
jgi:hypothetical protein